MAPADSRVTRQSAHYSRSMADVGCVFCGATPLTKEHLWPDWMRRQLATSERFDYRLEQEEDGVETRDLSFSSPPFTQTVRVVCATCNNGWMSAIEADAKPILEQLTEARGRHLHRAEQRKLAAWAFLKAIVFDHLHPSELSIPIGHREQLYSQREPPTSGVWIRVASYEACELCHYAYQGLKLARDGEPEPDGPTVYFVTLTVGALVVQVAGSLLPEWDFGGVPYPEELDVVEIWPSRPSADVAQRSLLTHETLVGFTKALYNVVGRLSGGAPPPR